MTWERSSTFCHFNEYGQEFVVLSNTFPEHLKYLIYSIPLILSGMWKPSINNPSLNDVNLIRAIFNLKQGLYDIIYMTHP